MAPLICTEQASTVSPRVTEWPEADLSLKQPFFYELDNIKESESKQVCNEITFGRGMVGPTIEERRHGRRRGPDARGLRRGM